MLEGVAVDCTSSFVGTVEVTGLIVLVIGIDVSFPFLTVVSVVLGTVNKTDVVRGAVLILEEDKVLAFPEVSVSCERLSVRVCPLREDEGVVVITAEIVLV